MPSKTQPVLCVFKSAITSMNNSGVLMGQSYAVANKLPLAVVVCAENVEKLPNYLELEKQLAVFEIPLLTLIGDLETRLEGVKYHLNPKRVFFDTDNASSTKSELRVHPIKWPSRIAPVQELIDAKGMAC